MTGAELGEAVFPSGLHALIVSDLCPLLSCLEFARAQSLIEITMRVDLDVCFQHVVIVIPFTMECISRGSVVLRAEYGLRILLWHY